MFTFLAMLGSLICTPNPVAASHKPPTVLRVLSYNIHHGEGTDRQLNLERIASVISRSKADLVALQEVDERTKRTKQVAQTAELARLTGLNGYFGKAIDYQGGEYGQAILSRFPCQDLKVHLLPGEPDREQRIALAGKVTIGTRTLTFVTTHLHHQNAEYRLRQASKITSIFSDSKEPVIVAGDLNTLPESEPLQVFKEPWSNATSQKALGTFPAGKPQRQIDYILFRPKSAFRVVSVDVIDEAVASDHRPILVVLEWQNSDDK